MAKDPTRTVRIRRIGKVAPDERGRSVWLGKVEPANLELVSTTALKKILKSEGGRTRTEIRKLAQGGKDGVLARDTQTGLFRIVSEEELRKAVPAPGGGGPERGGVVRGQPLSEEARRKADELSLVSTQILRKVVRTEPAKPRAGRKDRYGGFDPYDSG